MYEELGMFCVSYLVLVLNLAVLVAMETDCAVIRVLCVYRVMYSFHKAPESMATHIQLLADARKKG